MKPNKTKRNRIYKTLNELGILDKTELVETVDLVSKKPRRELRNYYKMMVTFFMELPESMLDTELGILKTKVENGEFLK